MNIIVEIIDGPLKDVCPWSCDGVGAVICFEGVVRAHEDEQVIRSLDYEVYQPMAGKQLESLADDIATTHGLVGIYVEHSCGEVLSGQRSFRLRIASVHRKEAIAAMDEFIDRMKQDVPIWKKPIFEAGGIVK